MRCRAGSTCTASQQVKNIAEPIRAYRVDLGSGTESARPQQKIEVPRQDPRETSNIYKTLMARLNPLLCRGIEDVLQRWKQTLKSSGDLNLVVRAPINGFHRVVGATYSAEHPMWQNSAKIGEGYQGFFADRKKAGYVRRFPGSDRKLFDRDGQVLHEAPRTRHAGVLSQAVDAKWMYYRPIFEKSAANPWSDRVVGNLVVHLSADDADRLFQTGEFQQQLDSIATEVSPYLDAIQVLTGEEKL